MGIIGDFLFDVGTAISRFPENVAMEIENAAWTATHPYSSSVEEINKITPTINNPAHVATPSKSTAEMEKSDAEKRTESKKEESKKPASTSSSKPYDFRPKKPDYHYGEKTAAKTVAEPSAAETQKSDVEKKIEYVYTVKNPKKPEPKKEEPKQEESKKEEPKKEDTVKQQSTTEIISVLFSRLNEAVQKKKADKGKVLLKEVVYFIMFSSRELNQNHSIESKKIINGIGSVFGLKELYPDVSTADISMILHSKLQENTILILMQLFLYRTL